MSVSEGPNWNSPNSADQPSASGTSRPRSTHASIEARLRDRALRRDDVAEQLVARHVEQMQLQVLVELQARDEPADAAPGRFERLERRVVQQRAHLLGDRRIHRRQIRPGLRRGVLDDVRRDDVADQRVEGRCRRGGRCGTGLGRFAQQAAEEIIGPPVGWRALDARPGTGRAGRTAGRGESRRSARSGSRRLDRQPRPQCAA